MRVTKENVQINRTELGHFKRNLIEASAQRELQVAEVCEKASVRYNHVCNIFRNKEKRVVLKKTVCEQLSQVLTLNLEQLFSAEDVEVTPRNEELVSACELLKTWRSRKNLTQKAIAEDLDLTPTDVSFAERGISKNHIDKIAVYLAPNFNRLEYIRNCIRGKTVVNKTRNRQSQATHARA